MRKEIIIAIIIGLILGLVITYGIRTARLSLENRQLSSQITKKTDPSTQQNTTSSHNLFITSPEPNTITDKDSISVVGTTTPFSLLSIVSNSDSLSTTADEDGNFTGSLKLEGGINTVNIESFNDTGEVAQSSFMIVYTTADLSATASAATKDSDK